MPSSEIRAAARCSKGCESYPPNPGGQFHPPTLRLLRIEPWDAPFRIAAATGAFFNILPVLRLFKSPFRKAAASENPRSTYQLA